MSKKSGGKDGQEPGALEVGNIGYRNSKTQPGEFWRYQGQTGKGDGEGGTTSKHHHIIIMLSSYHHTGRLQKKGD